jgi:hypothetical protein
MVQILISFDLRPGPEQEYADFVVQTGVPFWRSQPGILSVKGFRNILGASPRIVSEVECESLEAAQRVLDSAEYRAIVDQQARFVTNRSVLLLAPTGRTPEDRPQEPPVGGNP